MIFGKIDTIVYSHVYFKLKQVFLFELIVEILNLFLTVLFKVMIY